MFCRIFKAIWDFIERLIQKAINTASSCDPQKCYVEKTPEKEKEEVFIWGTPLRHITNDIEVVYRTDTKKYHLKLDTSWWFDTREEELAFLKGLQFRFLDYLNQKNHPNSINMNYIFWMSNPGELFVAESVEELYTNYSIFVAGFEEMFCQQKGNTYDHQL